MNNKYKKGAFIISIILLLVFLPLTVIGILYSKSEDTLNPNKEFHYENKLYFYTKAGDLLGTYECNFKNCGYASLSNNDGDYQIKYHESDNNKTELINSRYAFIADYKDEQSLVYLWDVKNNEEFGRYKSVKNYGIGINDNYYIIEAISGLYGLIKIENQEIKTVLPFSYEYLALQDDIDLETNLLNNEVLIAKKDGKWFLTDTNEAVITNLVDYPIIAFNDSSYIYINNNIYYLNSYDGSTKVFGNNKYINYKYNLIEITNSLNSYYVLDSNSYNLVSKTYSLRESDIASIEMNDSQNVDLKINDEIKETIEIS